MSNPSIFPFLPVGANSPPSEFPYDVVIDKAYPGIIFLPTEPNGVYQAIREVNGCQWFVTNADWNSNTLEWEQNSPQNPATPAYALEMCANGHMSRLQSEPTTIPGTPITWVPLFDIDGSGVINKTPSTVSTSISVESSSQTWDGGTLIPVNARTINVEDEASASNSTIDLVNVNGIPVWEVRKDGTLVVGKVPFSNVTNFSIPSGTVFVDPTISGGTFTGTSTFQGPIIAQNGETVSGGLTVFGGENITGGLIVDSFHDTGNAQIDGNEIINGNLTNSGTATLNNVVIDGTLTGPGAPTATVVESLDGSIQVTQPNANVYNIQFPNPATGQSAVTVVGLIPYTMWYLYNSPVTTPLTTGLIPPPALLHGLLAPLGSVFLTTGHVTIATIEARFSAKVKAGAGAQSVGGQVLNVSPQNARVFIDGTQIFVDSTQGAAATWSGNVPDDGNYHEIILHAEIDNTSDNFGVFVTFGPWLPSNTAGGLDSTKFSSIVAG